MKTLINGQSIYYDQITININGKEISCTGTQIPTGIICVSYNSNGKEKTKVVSHKEFQKQFNKNLKKIRIPRRDKKKVNTWLSFTYPNLPLRGLSAYKRIRIYNQFK